MSIKRIILSVLFEPKFRYKGMSVSMLGLPAFEDYKQASLQAELSRLKKDNYLTHKKGRWLISSEGIKYFKNKHYLLDKKFKNVFTEKHSKNLILMFDISESQKRERDWLRKTLRDFHYIMIQKSVWVGPSPLPKDFMNLLVKVKLSRSIKTFKLAKGYVHKK